jgi:chemotaxis protein methyltransferase CheR
VWCAGCATGEEAYSLAIAVRSVLPDVDTWQVTVLATDLNRGYLARAEAGLYGDWSLRDTDSAFKMANFTAEGKRFRVRPELREMVRFGHLNLAEDGYPSAAGGTTGLDLILCRNVLLYFGQELSQRVVGRLRTALVPGGWLVLGPSDPRPGLLAEFEMRASDGAVVYRRVDREVVLPLVTAREERVPLPPPPPVLVRRESVTETPDWHSAWVLARASADGGQLDLAEEHCRQAIKRGHLRPEPYYLFGALRLARGDDAGSLEAHRKALYVDPRFVPALLAQAAIHRRGGDPVRARQALVRAQRLLDGRQADEWVLIDDGLTVGRLRDAVVQALSDERLGA